MIDLWQSRRDTFVEVEYWSQIDDESLVKNYQIAYNKLPTGSFMAKEVSAYTYDKQVLGESIMVDDENVTLYTRDKVSDLKVNDKVKYNEKFYRVDSIQKNPIKKQKQFMKSQCSFEYYIVVRG